MTETSLNLHVDTLDGMGRRFAAAWKAAEAGRDFARDHVTFLSPEAFMAAMSPRRLELMRHLRREGPMSVRRLACELGRDYKSGHRQVAMLTATGLVARRARNEVAVVWDRVVTELALPA